MNKFTGLGRLTRDVELKYSQSGIAIAKFTIAINRRRKDEADFINCTAFNKTAETIAQYFKKGSQILAVGRLQIEKYEDKEGKKRTSAGIMIDEFYFVDKKSDNASNKNPKQDWSDIGKEVDLNDIGMGDQEDITF